MKRLAASGPAHQEKALGPVSAELLPLSHLADRVALDHAVAHDCRAH